jgi:hypothetical protein
MNIPGRNSKKDRPPPKKNKKKTKNQAHFTTGKQKYKEGFNKDE